MRIESFMIIKIHSNVHYKIWTENQNKISYLTLVWQIYNDIDHIISRNINATMLNNLSEKELI